MVGSLIQLAAYGQEDMFLTTDPQITYFKVVYKRHTNFTKEEIQQTFKYTPNFGKSVHCTIGRHGDLIGNIILVVTLPEINLSQNSRTYFAWVKRIGFALIKSVNVTINGYQIDKHYGSWMNIWAELTGSISGPHSKGYKKMIGDIDSLKNFTHTMSAYTLFIPLQFWFCRIPGMALPLISLLYSNVKVNVEFEESSNCYILSPTDYITCHDDIVSFIQYEYIEQNVDGDIRAGIFMSFDINTKRLYYYNITNTKFESIPLPSSDFDVDDAELVETLQTSDYGQKYIITGKTSQCTTFVQLNYHSTITSIAQIGNIKFVNCFLLVDYYYLDEEERLRFAQSKHDYLIEQLYYTPAIELTNTRINAKLTTENPCKLMVWTVQLKYIYDSKDYFNYTDTYRNKVFSYELFNVLVGNPVGKNIVSSASILGNGNERLTMRNSAYHEYIQQYQNTKFSSETCINMYSYALYPFNLIQPSGSFNTSLIDNIEIGLHLSDITTTNNPVLFRGYCICYNVLRIIDGLGGVVFTH